MKFPHILATIVLGTSACHAWIYSIQSDTATSGASSATVTSLDTTRASELTQDAGATAPVSTTSGIGDSSTGTSGELVGSASTNELRTTTDTASGSDGEITTAGDTSDSDGEMMSGGGTAGPANHCQDQGQEELSDGDLDGKPIRLVFTTSTVYTGNLGGVQGADEKCNETAKLAGLGGTYKAWLGATGASVEARMAASPLNQANREIVRTDGSKVDDDWPTLLSGWWSGCERCPSNKNLPHRLRRDECGEAIPEDELGFWSGSNPDGTLVGTIAGGELRCLDWTSSSVLWDPYALKLVFGGQAGDAEYSSWLWSYVQVIPCNRALRLICVQYALE